MTTTTTLSITPRDLQIAGPTREVYWRENGDLGGDPGPYSGEVGQVAIALDVDGEGYDEIHSATGVGRHHLEVLDRAIASLTVARDALAEATS